MNISLIYPEYKNDPSGFSEPLGILYIASVLRNNGHKVSFFDMTFNKDNNIIKKIVKKSDLIGISCTSLLFERASKILNKIKKLNRTIPCIIGGPHVTNDPRSALKAGFDYVIIGEGEITIKKLVSAIEKKSKIDLIDGLAFRKQDNIIINPKKSYITSLDTLPFPARDLFNYKQYFKAGLTEIGIISSRGCPYNCLYCQPMVNKLFGKKSRRRSAANVVKEIEQIVNNHKLVSEGKVKIFFKDDTLTLGGISWFKEFKKELIKRKLKIEWIGQTRLNNVNFELLQIMKECGLIQISFGVESGSQRILDYYKKGIRVEQAVKIFEDCKKLGIETFAYFMIGAPIETKEDLKLTFKLIKRIRPGNFDVYTTMPYPGNNLFDIVKKNNLLRTEGKIDYWSKHSFIKLQYLTNDDLSKYRRKIYRLKNKQLLVRYFSTFSQFTKLVQYVFSKPRFVFNYLKRSFQ